MGAAWGWLAAAGVAAWVCRRARPVQEPAAAREGTAPGAPEADARHELTGALDFIQRTVEDDKARLARELHDELGGTLTVAKMHSVWIKAELAAERPELAERLDRLAATIDDAVAIERRMVENLRPSLLDHLGLGPALEWYVKGACAKAELPCTLDLQLDGEPVARDVAIAVYRLVQDGLANVIEHGGGSGFSLDVQPDPAAGGWRLTMTHGQQGGNAAHRLVVMRERVRALGGRLQLLGDGDPGLLRVSALLPFQQIDHRQTAGAVTSPAAVASVSSTG